MIPWVIQSTENTTKVELFAVSSGMAIAIQTNPMWYHLHNGLVERDVKGLFNYVNWPSKKTK
jgi:hypothetical protein